MNETTVLNIRLPGYMTPIELLVPSTFTTVQALQQIAAEYHINHTEQMSLVISPTSKKNGGILDSTRPFSSFKLDENDVLEMWFKPRLIQVAVQTSEGKAKLKKVIALDYGLPLAFLVSNIQTCFEIGLDEFVFQASTVAADGSVSHAGWLNANETLEAQRFSGDSCLLLVPLDILELMPARSLSQNSEREGWLFKESFKNGKLTPRKKRYCILRSQFLFYFKNENDSSPAGVIPLAYYSAKKAVKDKENVVIVRRTFRGFVSERADAFLFVTKCGLRTHDMCYYFDSHRL